jgi:hypothetical protein
MDYVFVVNEKLKKVVFKENGRKRYKLGDGIVMVNADVILADGTHFFAVLEIDEESSGELCGTHLLLPQAIASQGEEDFLSLLGKTTDQIFPYKYKLRTSLHCVNIHTGEDGWSR